MIKRLYEIIVSFIVWLAITFLLTILMPPRDMDFVEIYSYLACSMLITLFLYWIYVKIRNKRFINRLYSLIYENRFDEAKLLLQQAAKDRPKLFWLKIETASFLAYSGDFLSFYYEYDNLYNNRAYKKNGYAYRLIVIKDMVDFLLKGSSDNIGANIPKKQYDKYITSYFDDAECAINYYSSDDFGKSAVYARQLIQAPVELFRCVGYYILSNVLKDDTNTFSEERNQFYKDSKLIEVVDDYRKIK